MSGYIAVDHSRDCSELARDLLRILPRLPKSALRAAEILPHLHALEGSPWQEWKPGRPLTAMGLWTLLREMGATRTTKLRIGTNKRSPQYQFYARSELFRIAQGWGGRRADEGAGP